MTVFNRPPSTAWEHVDLPGAGARFVWVWYHPPTVSGGLVLRIPPETFTASPTGEPLTLRRLLQIVGVDPAWVGAWSVYGVSYEGQGGTNPSLDHPIPPPAAGMEAEIAVSLVQPQPVVTPPVSAPAGDLTPVFNAIEATWNGILKLETQLAAARRQLVDMQNRLSALNRELSMDERLHADRQDKTDWQTARRWLRDVAVGIARGIKEHDLGESSSAGKRNWVEETYQQWIAPRRPFEGIYDVQREFDAYRKMVQTLLSSMNSAHANAAQNGERRAQQVLSRIAAKVRAAKTKRK